MIVALRIAKEGYYSGDPGKVLDAPLEDVITIIEYEDFNVNYQKVYSELNKGE